MLFDEPDHLGVGQQADQLIQLIIGQSQEGLAQTAASLQFLANGRIETLLV